MEVTDDIFEEYPHVVTIEQLREMLHIGRTLAYKLIYVKDDKSSDDTKINVSNNSSEDDSLNRIEAFKCGRSYRILKSKIIEYLKRQ